MEPEIRRKETLKFMVEINEIRTRKTAERSTKLLDGFSKRKTKMEKPLVSLKKKKEDSNKIKTERGDVTMYFKEMHRFIRDYHVNALENV